MLGVQPVNSLVTFHPGGTLSETPGGVGFAPGQRSPGHGAWHHAGGQTYTQKFVAMINFTTTPGPGSGFEAGWQTMTHTVQLIDRDNLESTGTSVFSRWSDGVVSRSGCSTATGRRLE